jgi:uncharacterized protein (TIGR02996 family)
MRTFEFHDTKSHNFWTIDLRGSGVIVTQGKVGTSGKTQTKTFASAQKAQAAADKLVRDKIGKGYVETTPLVATAGAVAFERALAEDRDDVAGWSAYADYLTEQGNPRGEFMQVQLALEDEARSKADRRQLQAKEKELLKKHEREWLGELAPLVLDAEPIYRDIRRMEHRFARGWLAELLCRALTVAEARVFARTPQARLLASLAVEGAEVEAPAGVKREYIDSYFEPGPDVPADVDPYTGPALLALAHAPHLGSVRVFRLGDGPTAPGDDAERHGPCHTAGTFVHEVIARVPRLEELYLYAHDVQAGGVFAYPMPRLRILRFDHAREYPLDVLAKNLTLGNLTHLLCHPHAQWPEDRDAYIRLDQLRAICRSPNLRSLTHLQLRLTDFGDDGVEEVVASGVLKRLRVLDLSNGCVTDRGAAVLAACPDLKNLSFLNLTRNALSEGGIAALKATGVNVETGQQHDEHPDRMGENGYLDYLCDGDME